MSTLGDFLSNFDIPLWAMLLMLLAVVGLIVLLIYLRKKDREG